ncbi:MAG: hypothetical protein C0592_02060 [Marinilabiliales bacterium]|nr:MAG: hypothetical protein C0592_02060 [Marinilabiliales bacterium]
MKARFFLVLILFFTAGSLLAQEIQLASEAEFKRFKSSTTYLVKYDDPFSMFNAYMEEDMKAVWTITPYKIISSEEFEDKMKDKEASFIFLSEAMKDDQGVFFKLNVLNIVLGARSGNLNNMPDLGSAPLSYVFDDWDDEDVYLYKLAGILRFFQFYVNYNISHPGSDFKDVVKANKSKIEGKQLWLIKGDMDSDVDSESEISKYYDGTVKFVSEEDIRTAVHNGNTNVVFLHKVGPNGQNGYHCMKFLINAGDGTPVYYDMHKVSNGKSDAFLSSDFKSL